MHTMVANASCSLSILMLGFGMSSATSCGFMPFSPLTVLSSASAVSAALQSGAVQISSVLHSRWSCAGTSSMRGDIMQTARPVP
jgi:hypothetical protein